MYLLLPCSQKKAFHRICLMASSIFSLIVICKFFFKNSKNNSKKVLENNSLDVIIECNMKTVNYLDVTFHLNGDTYQLCQKPDNIIQYMPIESNQPLNILKKILKTIEKPLFLLFFNEDIQPLLTANVSTEEI